MFTIDMESDEFGMETFHYDNREDMQAGLLRLVDMALLWAAKDGIARSFVVAEDKTD